MDMPASPARPPIRYSTAGRPNAPNRRGSNVVISAMRSALDAQDVELERAELRVAGPAQVAGRRRHAVRARSAAGASRPSRSRPNARSSSGAIASTPVVEPRVRAASSRGCPRASARPAAVGVAALVGVDEAREQRALVRARLRRGPSARRVRQLRAQRRARALQRAVGGGDAECRAASAVSAADQPEHVAQRSATARWRGGSSWIDGEERELDRLAGDDDRVRLLVAAARPRRAAGPGTAAATAPRRPCSGAPARGARSASRQTFVAIRYSHARSVGSPVEASRARARRAGSVSCTASSASSNEPSIR